MRHDDIPPALNGVTDQVIGAAIEVHRELGPGLLERIYEEALAHEFGLRRVPFERQVDLPVRYKQAVIVGQRADLIVAGAVVLELKAVEKVADVHLAQLVTYMCIARLPVGLLLNFNVAVMKSGIHRRVNGSSSAFSAPPRSIPC